MGNILAVNEEKDVSKLITRILEEKNHDVNTCSSGGGCLETFQPKEFDLVLIDTILPDMDGWEVYNKIKKIDENQNIIFLTIFETPEIPEKEELETESIDYVKKPFTPEELTKKVELILGKEES